MFELLVICFVIGGGVVGFALTILAWLEVRMK